MSIDFLSRSEDYGDPQFQELYIRVRLCSGKAMKLLRALMQKAIESGILQGGRSKLCYSVLSLGCGPGCDILAGMKIFQSVARRYSLPNLQVEFTGVDQYRWPLGEFKRRFDACVNSAGQEIQFHMNEVLVCPMETFVNATDCKFDFILLCFADVKTKLELVGSQLVKLLSDGGRIVVVDNNIGAVRRLGRYGFTQRRVIGGKSVCLEFCKAGVFGR